MSLDSRSMGDPARFLTLEALESALYALPTPSKDSGHVTLIVRRAEGGRREPLDRVRLMPEAGVPGDAWERRENRKIDAQIAVMQADVAELIANHQPLMLFGDNLFLRLDLSAANLPPGSRVRVGAAVLEVTPKPHDGCRKFRGRFGDGALGFVSKKELRHRNLRGIYMRVVEEGDVAPDDIVQVLARVHPLPSANH
jgi:MOSC domain-containing protein YiiM